MTTPSFAAGSGQTPEAYAMAMLICGPSHYGIMYYATCFKKKVKWIKGMGGSERRLAFKRGELTGTRENPAAYKKHVEPDSNAEIWFHHGILQADGSHTDDPNYPGFQFEELYKQKWGAYPVGEMYDAYKLVKSFRDGMQKALWVNEGNPNAKVLQDALTEMSNNAESSAIIEKKVGKYEWLIGEEGNAHRDTLMTFVTPEALEDLVWFNIEALGLKSVFKIELALK
jgi:hypothetical protein